MRDLLDVVDAAHVSRELVAGHPLLGHVDIEVVLSTRALSDTTHEKLSTQKYLHKNI